MAVKKTDHSNTRKIANVASIVMVFAISAVFAAGMLLNEIPVNQNFAGLVIIAAIAFIIPLVRTRINQDKLGLTVPLVILLFYTALMMLSGWYVSNYLLICFALCAISCIYSNFGRTIAFMIVQNLAVGALVILGAPVCGHNLPLTTIIVNWAICLFASIIMLILTRAATIYLNRALEHQNSFMDLLATTENFVAMVDDRNEIVYASKTLATLGNADEPAMIQGRPLIDLFPGRSLKIYAGKLLKDKDDYADDWEFTLNGQKRYFKAASHRLSGTGGTLISLYDMTHLAERDEIAVMKDSMKIGLFFMDKNYVIQDHYSRYLEEMLSDTKLFGRLLTDVIADSVNPSEMEAIKDYFRMVIDRTYDQEMLEDINPLSELHYMCKRSGTKKVFQFAFATVERGRGEVYILVTLYDITTRVELQQRLAEEEARRQEEMQSVFELIQVQPDVFNDFMGDMEHEFDNIDKIQKNETLSAHDALVKIYQSVHAIKSNAVILGLNVFGNKVHNLESRIKKLREIQGDIPFGEMLNLTMDIERISNEKEGFRDIINKLKSYTGAGGGGANAGKKQNVKVLIDSLKKTTEKAAEDQEKLINFIANDIDEEAIEKGPRRVMKDILMQLIRNSAVHGIEMPDARKALGKNETGTIKLSIKLTPDRKFAQLKLSDDGSGLDYRKIAQKALSKKLIKKEEAGNKDLLLKAIFSPGFSTADTEGVHAGRGIGLNLVRDRLKEINGTIKLRSEDKKGIIFLVTVPLEK
ncbi:MAG: ATP-binding protein [Treponema sp.]|nr:ATP-binding protein [Treponema sp.]